jgi:hypothetical protein
MTDQSGVSHAMCFMVRVWVRKWRWVTREVRYNVVMGQSAPSDKAIKPNVNPLQAQVACGFDDTPSIRDKSGLSDVFAEQFDVAMINSGELIRVVACLLHEFAEVWDNPVQKRQQARQCLVQ